MRLYIYIFLPGLDCTPTLQEGGYIYIKASHAVIYSAILIYSYGFFPLLYTKNRSLFLDSVCSSFSVV